MLAYPQKIVTVKTGEKDAEKQFLGYKFSDRRGSEGIHAIQRGKSIDECTHLFDMNTFDNPQKASTYIYRAFNGDTTSEIDDSLKDNISRVNLLDMLTFDRVDFEKVINVKAKKKIKIESKYPIVTLDYVCKEIFAGGDLPKDAWCKDATTKFNIPIYSNGIEEKALYGYTNIARVNENALSISARGTIGYSALRRAPFYPIVRLIIAIPNPNIINLRYLYEISKYLNFTKSGKTTPQLTVPMVKPTKLPLPPLDIQQKIVDEIEKVEKILLDSSNNIDKNRNDILETINSFKQKQEKLDGFIILNEETKNPKLLNEEYFTYVDIDAVENATGKICFHKQVESQKAPSRARRIAKSKSVLISTVRPYLKAFAYIENEFENTIYSTGFAIIRSKNEDKLLSKYLYYLFMYNENLMDQMKAAMPKGQYPSINDKDIRNFTIPIPLIEEQEKIVSQIEKLEKQITEAQAIIDNSKQQKQEILDKYLK